MENNFLNNYKKKAEEIGAVTDSGEKKSASTNNPHIVKEESVSLNSEKIMIEDNKSETLKAQNEKDVDLSFLTKEEPKKNAKPVEKKQEEKMKFTQDSGFVMKKSEKPSFMGDPNAPKKKPVKQIAGIGIALVLVIGLVWFFTRGAEVPNMETWAYSQATFWSNENGVLINRQEEYNDIVAEGTIISQSHPEGERLSGEDVLTVIVSLGPDLSIMVPVPDLMNMTLNEVEAWADENLMTTVRITTEESDTVPIGKMISYSINDNTVIGTEIRRDSPLYITFSKGEGEGEAVKLSNFLTMSVDEVKTFASDNNLVLIVEEEFSENVLKGNIIRQSIKANETVYEGDTITIYVSKGEEVRVPNFTNLSKQAAELEAQSKGISVIVTEKYVMNVDEGKLVSQSVSAGSLYQDNTYVELVYSLGYRVLVPSFVGQNEEAIRTWVTEYNENGADFKVSSTYTESNKPYGTVLSQTKANNTLDTVATLEFVISSGPIIYTPDFVADEGSPISEVVTREKALAMADTAGIVVVFHEESTTNRQPGEVWWQSVNAGTEIKSGETVTLKVQPLEVPVLVPDFTGMDEASARSLAEQSKLIVEISVGAYIDDTSIDKVVNQTVTAGSTVAVGTKITFTLGGEKVEETVSPTTQPADSMATSSSSESSAVVDSTVASSEVNTTP